MERPYSTGSENSRRTSNGESRREASRQVPPALPGHEGEKIPARGSRSRRHPRFQVRAEGRGEHAARARHRVARRGTGEALRAGPLGRAARLPGDGRGGQGQHDQARHVGRQSARRARDVVQGAVERGARSRFHVALHEGAARARAHRHLQPELLRGSAGRPGAQGVSREAEARAEAADQDASGRNATRTSRASSATSRATATSS